MATGWLWGIMSVITQRLNSFSHCAWACKPTRGPLLIQQQLQLGSLPYLGLKKPFCMEMQTLGQPSPGWFIGVNKRSGDTTLQHISSPTITSPQYTSRNRKQTFKNERMNNTIIYYKNYPTSLIGALFFCFICG